MTIWSIFPPPPGKSAHDPNSPLLTTDTHLTLPASLSPPQCDHQSLHFQLFLALFLTLSQHLSVLPLEFDPGHLLPCVPLFAPRRQCARSSETRPAPPCLDIHQSLRSAVPLHSARNLLPRKTQSLTRPPRPPPSRGPNLPLPLLPSCGLPLVHSSSETLVPCGFTKRYQNKIVPLIVTQTLPEDARSALTLWQVLFSLQHVTQWLGGLPIATSGYFACRQKLQCKTPPHPPFLPDYPYPSLKAQLPDPSWLNSNASNLLMCDLARLRDIKDPESQNLKFLVRSCSCMSCHSGKEGAAAPWAHLPTLTKPRPPRLPYLRICAPKVQSLHSQQLIQTLPASPCNHSLATSIQSPYSCLDHSKDPILTNLLKELILTRPLKDRHCFWTECGNLDSISMSCAKDRFLSEGAKRHCSVSKLSHIKMWNGAKMSEQGMFVLSWCMSL